MALEKTIKSKIEKDIKKNTELSATSAYPVEKFEVDLKETFGRMLFLGLMREKVEEDEDGLFVGEVTERTYNIFLIDKGERIPVKVPATEDVYNFKNGSEVELEGVELTPFANANDFGLGIRCSKIKLIGSQKQEQPKQEQKDNQQNKDNK